MRVTRQLVGAEGAPAVSMRQVADLVGVTPMTIYRHFANRDELLRSVADECLVELAARSAGRPPPDDLDRWAGKLLEEHLDFALREPHLYDLVFTQARPGARQFPADFRAGHSPTLNLVAEGIDHGARHGSFRPDTDTWEVTLTIAALLHGLVALYRGGRIGLSEAEFRVLCHRTTQRIIDGIRI